MSAVTRVLDRLDGVRRTAPEKWRARCPSHQSRSLSLAIAEGRDGLVLLKCFAGCAVGDVLQAIDLESRDLFERPMAGVALHGTRLRSPWNARDVLDLAVVEIHIVGIVASDILQRRTIGEQDWQRLSQASGRLLAMASEVQR